MKARKYSEGQIFRILKEVESGMPVVNAAREHGVSPATIHRWRSKYGGMTLSELKRPQGTGRRECQAEADRGTKGIGQRAAEGEQRK